MWEITLGELLPLKVEFGKIVFEGSIIEHRLFMKKDKLVCGAILQNVVEFLLHHVARVEIAKDAWDNFYATFEKKHIGNRLQLHRQFYNLNMEERTSLQAHIDKFWMIANQLTNIDH